METAAYGAHVELVDGLISDAGKACAVQAAQHGWYDCSTLKEPYRPEVTSGRIQAAFPPAQSDEGFSRCTEIVAGEVR